MKPSDIRDEIDKLALPEKLLLVEDIWDSIAASNADLPMPEWQEQELTRRYEQYKKGQLELHEWSAVHQGLRERHK
jgi:putative addiction module component (TIGR02574 family)